MGCKHKKKRLEGYPSCCIYFLCPKKSTVLRLVFFTNTNMCTKTQLTWMRTEMATMP